MKLIYCPDCHDMIAMQTEEWRDCKCGQCGGQYNADRITATVVGKTKVLGIPNPFLDTNPKSAKKGECWFGGFKGDNQIFRRKTVRKIFSHDEILNKFKPVGPNLMSKENLNKATLEYFYQKYTKNEPDYIARAIALGKFPKGN